MCHIFPTSWKGLRGFHRASYYDDVVPGVAGIPAYRSDCFTKDVLGLGTTSETAVSLRAWPFML